MRWIRCCEKTTAARRDSLRRGGIHLLLLALLCGSAICQETTLHSQSNVVVIPALVKSAQGEALYGLTAKDFVVEDTVRSAGSAAPAKMAFVRRTQLQPGSSVA